MPNAEITISTVGIPSDFLRYNGTDFILSKRMRISFEWKPEDWEIGKALGDHFGVGGFVRLRDPIRLSSPGPETYPNQFHNGRNTLFAYSEDGDALLLGYDGAKTDVRGMAYLPW